MSAASKVWFISVDDNDDVALVAKRLKAVLAASGFDMFIHENTVARVKMHFGEDGNTGHVRPELVRVIADMVAAHGGSTVVSDTNTLYRGRRTTCDSHIELACDHRFTSDITGALLEIPDEHGDGAVREIACNGRFIHTAHIMRVFTDAQLLIGLAHFKGHQMTGFGGALKNIGMGCASREGKLAQHSAVAPFVVTRSCIGCSACVQVCPADAIAVIDGKAVLASGKCIGCASCIAACAKDAVRVDWGSGAGAICEKMVEYAAATLSGKGKKIFVNVVLHITAECDCIAEDDPCIVPGVGILVSTDPVAIDQASYDLVCIRAGGYDPFLKAHPGRDIARQLDYAEQLGIGVRGYELVRLPA